MRPFSLRSLTPNRESIRDGARLKKVRQALLVLLIVLTLLGAAAAEVWWMTGRPLFSSFWAGGIQLKSWAELWNSVGAGFAWFGQRVSGGALSLRPQWELAPWNCILWNVSFFRSDSFYLILAGFLWLVWGVRKKWKRNAKTKTKSGSVTLFYLLMIPAVLLLSVFRMMPASAAGEGQYFLLVMEAFRFASLFAVCLQLLTVIHRLFTGKGSGAIEIALSVVTVLLLFLFGFCFRADPV